MFKLVTVILFIGSASAFQFKLTVLKNSGTAVNETRGIVDPSSCGRPVGNFIQMRVSDCDGDTTPCRLTASSEIEIDFRASKNSTNASLILTVTPLDGTPEFETLPIPSMPGEDLTLTLLDFEEIITSQEVNLQIAIVNDVNAVEICLSSSFNKGVVRSSTASNEDVSTISTNAPTDTSTTCTTSDAPTSTTDASIISTNAPTTTTTGAPTRTTKTDAPSFTTDAPSSTTDAPSSTTDASTISTSVQITSTGDEQTTASIPNFSTTTAGSTCIAGSITAQATTFAFLAVTEFARVAWNC